MTPKDNFLAAYSNPAECYCGASSCLSLEHLVDTLLREHAHELAERQRAHMTETNGDWDGYTITNLIDPIRKTSVHDPEAA